MKKRVFILCLAICVLFAMSSVCASDVNDTAIASQDTMAEVAQSDDLATADEISQTDDGEILPAGKDIETLSAANDLDILGANGTYSELRDKIGTGGLIDLDSKTYIYDSGDTIEITEDGTVINGKGAIIDMNKSSTKAFHVNAKNVVFIDLSIINVNFTGSGGAIYFTQPGTVMGCNFTDNIAEYDGGAVYFAGEGQLLNCNFARNKADNGGAVYFNGNGTVMNCNFDGNKVRVDDGGAIYFGNEVSGCNINATFKENQASRYGGAIYFKEASSNVNIYGEFEKNKADCGGAILFHDGRWDSCTNLFINATFKENEAKRGTFGSDGGAIAFINSGIVDSCINSIFIENVAECDDIEYEADGGAINFYAINNVTINGEFKGNSAEYGSAIHCDHEVSNLNVNAIFIDNQATRDGGAIYLSKNSNNVYIGGEFKDNEALNKNGGAINFNGDVSNSTINATFIGNEAFDHGGAIYFNGGVSGSNMTSTFKNNVARDNGGAIYFNNKIDNVLIYGEFNDNPADYGGAIYFKEVSDSNIKAIFIGNSVRNDEGAAIYFDGKITNVGISGNYINNTGKSVICIKNAGTGNKIHDSIFLNNNVSEIINVTAGNITVNNNWFGNTVLNYTETPVNVGIELDNWLFLDSKLVPEIKPVGKASDIIFLLKAYNPDSGMSDYDNALLTPLSLKIIAEGGTIPKDRVNLGEAVKYTPTALGTGCATATIDNIQVTVDFTIKTNPDLSLETAQLVYSGNSTITLSYNDTASGKINITLNGKKFNASFTNIDLNKTISLGNINADDYEVTISYSGDNQFAEDVVVKSLVVSKADAEIIIASATLDMKALEYASAGASLSPAAGSLNYYSNNSSVAAVEDGVIMAFSKGTATITVLFAGNDNYRPAEIKNITVNVGLNDASVIVDSPALNLNVGDTYAINATTIPPIIKVFVTYTSSNESVVTVDENGTVTAVGEGNAVITVAIGDDVVYAKNSTAVNVTVQKSKTVINADAVIATYNVDKNLVITLKDAKGNALSNLTISVSLDSTKTYSTDKNGQVIINVAKLVPKTYTAKITFDGNSKYLASSANVTVTVNKAKSKIVAKKKTFKKAKKVKKYAITLKSGKTKISNAKVTLKIKGKKAIKAKTNKKGKATFKIKKLNKKGTYKATIKFKGNAYYTKATKKAKIKIK